MKRVYRQALATSTALLAFSVSSAYAGYWDRYDGTYQLECATDDNRAANADTAQHPTAAYYKIALSFYDSSTGKPYYILDPKNDSDGDGLGDGIIRAECGLDSQGKRNLIIAQDLQEKAKSDIFNKCRDVHWDGVNWINSLKFASYTPDPAYIDAQCSEFSENVVTKFSELITGTHDTPNPLLPTPFSSRANQFTVDFSRNAPFGFYAWGNEDYTSDGEAVGTYRHSLYYTGFGSSYEPFNTVINTGACVGTRYFGDKQAWVHTGDSLSNAVITGLTGKTDNVLTMKCLFPGLTTAVDVQFGVHNEYKAVKQ